MFLKFIAAILSAITIAAVATYLDYHPEMAASDAFYSYERQLAGGMVIMLTIYIVFLIPLSVGIDGMIARYYPYRGFERTIAALASYFVVPAFVFFIVFLVFTSTTYAAELGMLIGIGGLIHCVVQKLLRRLWEMVLRGK
ncbi:hypothetical protein [Paenibacillus montanisoli]|uniref:Uncharacterized protein n=1 Tax=Paenibacillus montanisoli TaxID=2081970 RepID=A0A328U9A0_9BACL|nr:hypothetical protein [Paenibacillus montanisoli]RAP78393.1 hypothetical protein DL346_08205 [Paenibacillus montanisoli]